VIEPSIGQKEQKQLKKMLIFLFSSCFQTPSYIELN